MNSQNIHARDKLPTMGIYDKYLLPKLVHFTCGQNPSMRQREKVVPLAKGRVLEIGIGSGLNIPFYDAQKVEHLWGLDPSAEMWSIAQKNAAEHHLDAEFIQSGAESIPLDNNSADTVLMTFTMCTIPDVSAALDEIRRVLKPTGRLIFCEHGKAPDESVQRWQNRFNPVWRMLAGGCNLNRSIPDLLAQSGYKSDDMQTMYLPGWKPATFNYWGTARY
jgi:ubiquinone/menaquinone biosynthesis C-methylase UbiE